MSKIPVGASRRRRNLVVATALHLLVIQSGPAARLLSHLTLSWENNLGAVAISPFKLVRLGSMELSLRMLVLAAVSILVGAACAAAPSGRAGSYALGTVIVVSLAAVAVLSINLMLVYLLSELLGLAVYWVNAETFQTEI